MGTAISVCIVLGLILVGAVLLFIVDDRDDLATDEEIAEAFGLDEDEEDTL